MHFNRNYPEIKHEENKDDNKNMNRLYMKRNIKAEQKEEGKNFILKTTFYI